MIRLLFVSCFVSILFSCDYSSNTEPLVYQMSQADSTRCMDEILDGIIKEARREQQYQDSIYELFYNPNLIVCGVRDVLGIYLNSSGQLMVGGSTDSVDIVDTVYQYFMFNRNLTEEETGMAAMNPNYEGYDKPFYNSFGLKYIEKKIQECAGEVRRVQEAPNTDPAIIEYYLSRVDYWEAKKKGIKIIGTDKFKELSPQAILRFEYLKETKQTQVVLNEIAFAFYQMRNYECLKYFDETYLSLYERAQRLERGLEQEKLEVLKLMRPSRIVIRDRSKPYTGFVEDPPKSVN
jgi:hypothetical protein